jgi:3',5'-cyclic-AMP phosphodiesterase
MNRKRYIHITDPHLLPWKRFKLLNIIMDQKPHGIFLTGDISLCSQTMLGDLEFLGKRIGAPLYFVYGNHDLFLSNIEKTNNGIRKLCAKYKNLIWMTESDVISLSDEVGLIGEEGFYDAFLGDPKWLRYTFDWFMIEDFRKLSSMKKRIEAFQELAKNSAKNLSNKLEMALENHKTVYLLTHYPPWKEANRCGSLISEEFWKPYNTNLQLGNALEKVMENHKKRKLIVLSGHVHPPSITLIHVNRNIECWVGMGSYYKISNDQTIYI